MLESISFIDCKNTLCTILQIITEKKPGMYLRFGDGDFNLAENKDDMLAKSNTDLKNKMLSSMSIRDDRVMICIPHHCKEINTLENGMYPGNHEYPYDYIIRFLTILKQTNDILPSTIYTNIALSYCSVHYPDTVIQLHKEIQKSNVIYIGNYKYSNEFLKKLFGENLIRIDTNDNNAFDQMETVFEKLNILMNITYSHINYFVIVIAAGCASRAFASIIYNDFFIKNPNFFLLDYGSLLDYLYGLNTRAYMDLMPPKKDYILSRI
jgi:hypothetical protein